MQTRQACAVMAPNVVELVPQPRVAKRGWIAFGLLVAALSYSYGYHRTELCPQMALAPIEPLADGIAFTPFQYRILVPLLYRGAFHLVGRESLTTIIVAFETTFFAAFLVTIAWWLRRLAFPLASVAVFTALGAALPLFTHIVPRVAPYLMPYDTAVLALFTASLAALSFRAWRLYYVLFVVGTLTRETTFLLTLAMALGLWGSTRRRDIAAHVAAQAALWIAIKTALAFAFRDNPGAGLFEITRFASSELHLVANLRFLTTATSAAVLLSVAGGLWIVRAAFGGLLEDPLLRRAWWLLPAYALVMLWIGVIGEVRIFGEFLGLATVSAALIARESLMRGSTENRAEEIAAMRAAQDGAS